MGSALRSLWRSLNVNDGCRALQFNMLVSYTYRSDDPEPGDEVGGTPSRTHGTSKAPEMKNFSFYTVVDLGAIVPREETRHDPDI